MSRFEVINKIHISNQNVTPLPKSIRKKLKKKKSNLQKRKDNSGSKLWKNKADKAWGLCIHTVYSGCAVGIGCAGNLEAHHLISRSHVLTRHMRINGILLCTKHHKYDIKLSPHGGPVGFVAWLQYNRPEQFAWVRDNKYLTGQKPDYEARYNELRKVIDRLEGLIK